MGDCDGAAAVVGVGSQRAEAMGILGPRVIATQSRFYPDTERVMGWDVEDTGFQIVLDASVPDVVRRFIRSDVDGFLADQGKTLKDIDHWIAHPGGPKVLTAFEDCLELPPGALQRTWDSLNEVGNFAGTSNWYFLISVRRNLLAMPSELSFCFVKSSFLRVFCHWF